MKYTGTATPAARNAATPHAVAWRLPCLLAWAKTPSEIALAIATAARNAAGLVENTFVQPTSRTEFVGRTGDSPSGPDR